MLNMLFFILLAVFLNIFCNFNILFIFNMFIKFAFWKNC